MERISSWRVSNVIENCSCICSEMQKKRSKLGYQLLENAVHLEITATGFI